MPMVVDLLDVGFPGVNLKNIFITNSGSGVMAINEKAQERHKISPEFKLLNRADNKATLEKFAKQIDDGLEAKDRGIKPGSIIFTTYDQTNARSGYTHRMEFLESVVSGLDTVLVLDESHKDGGTGLT